MAKFENIKDNFCFCFSCRFYLKFFLLIDLLLLIC